MLSPKLHLDQLEDRTTPTVDNILVHGTDLKLDNGGLFTHFLGGGGGAGTDKFLSIDADGVEQGYNTNAKPLDLDTKEPTRAILLSAVPLVNVGGVNYYEFVLDAIQTGNNPAIIFNELRVYTSPSPIDNLNGYNAAARTLGGQLPVYDMDYVGAYPGTLQNHDLLVDGVGSGEVDLAILIPQSVFGTLVPANNYVYLYTKLGDISGMTPADVPSGYSAADFRANGGQEHFAFGNLQTPQSPLTDLTIAKTDGITSIGPGDTNTYTMTVTNNGPTPVTEVQLIDVVPDPAWYTVTNPANPFTPSTGTYTPTYDVTTHTYSGIWTLNLAVGASATITFSGTVAVSATQPIVNRAEVYTSGVVGELDSTLGDNVATDTDSLAPRADLQIAKTDGITTIAAGQSLIYTIVVSNAGPSSVTGATITDAFPAELQSVNWTAVQSGGASGFTPSGSGAINATVNMPSGSTITYTVNATVNPATTSTAVSNTATVAPPPGVSDPTPGNNSATDTDTITSLADLRITKNNADEYTTPGMPLGYVITITNAGPSNVIGTSVTDTIPASLTGATWTATATGGATGFDASGSGNINDTGINMPVGSTITYTVSATVSPLITPVGTPTISNTASVSVPAGLTDPNLGNNSATHVDTLLAAPLDLSADKIAPPPVVPGTFVTYTVTFTNTNSLGIPVVGAPVTDNFADLSGLFAPGTVTWAVNVGASSLGASAGVGSGTGNLVDTVNLPANAHITYTVTGQVRPDAVLSGKTQINNTATIDVPAGYGDTNPTNNIISRTVPLATPLVDLAIAKTDGADTEIPGTSISYTITVSNAGPSTIDSVTLADTQSFLQPGFTFTPSSGAYSAATEAWTGLNLTPGGSVVMTLAGTINPAATGTITNTATVSAPAGVDETNLSNNTASDTDTLTPQADLSILKTDGVSSAIPGQILTYTITVSNAGPSNVVGATVSDTFPGIITSTTWTANQTGGASGFDASGSGSIINDSGINMPVGSIITYTVTAAISPAATGTLANTATVAAPAGVDPNLANNSSTDTDTLTPQADLAITKTDGQTSAVPGSQIIYTIVVRNNGLSDANGVEIADTIPATITGVTWTAVPTGAATNFTSPGAGNIIADNVNMPAGSTITYTVTGTISPTATGTLDNTATVTPPGGVADPIPGNNSATDSDNLVPTADLAVTKDDGVFTVGPGQAVTYTIVVSNFGPSAVTGATVSDSIPTTLTGVSWSASGTAGTVFTPGPVASNTIADTVNMPVGSTIIYTISGTVDITAVSGLLVNTATVNPPTGLVDPVAGNNSATDTDQIEPAPGLPTDLFIQKTDGVTYAVPGSTVTYLINLINFGPNPVVGASITDTIPAILTNVSWVTFSAGGATGNTNGSGNTISQTVDMAVNSQILYVVTGTISASATGTLTNTAVIAPAGVTDTNPGNNTSTDIDNLTPQADLEITKTDGATTAIPGDPITYTIVVSNAGLSDVVGATVRDLFPPGLLNPSWTSIAAGGAGPGTAVPVFGNINQTVNLPAGSSITYSVNGTISQFATGTLENIATVDVPAAVTETDPSDNSATDTDALIPTANLSITKSDGALTAIPGSSIVYSIVVRNSGPSAAVGAAILDTIPAALTGVTWTASSPDVGTVFSPTGVGDIIDTVTMPIGSTITYTISAGIDPAATGALVNTATVTAPTGTTDPDTSDNSATDSDQLIPTGNLTVTKDNGISSVVAGQAAPVVYTITINNSGPSTLTSLILDDALPPVSQFTFLSFDIPAGAAYDPVSKVLSGITLVPGGSITGTITGTIPSSATGTLSNTVVVTPPAGTGDSATDSDPINLVSDLRVEKTDLSDLVRAGESVPYLITVWNDGPSDVIGATLRDVFPPEMLPNAAWFVLSATANASSSPSSGVGNISASLTIPSNGSIQFQVNRVLSPTILPPGITTNTASIAVPGGAFDPNLANNTSTHVDEILPAQVDLSATKTANASPVIPSQLASYSITFANTNGLAIPVVGAAVSDTFANPGLFVPGTVAWGVTGATGGSTATLGSGTGDLSDTVTLPAGATITYTITGTVSPTARGQINNTAAILPPAGVEDTNGANNSASATVPLAPTVDLSVAKTDGSLNAIPGTPITYTVTLTNLGPSALNDTDGPVALVDAPQFLLPGYTIAASSGNYDPLTGIWTGLNLAPLGTATLTLSGMIDSGATGTMTNTATVTGPGTVTDPDLNNNIATDTDTLTPQSNVSIVKTNPITTPNFYSEIPGLSLTYLITVSNAGPSNATGVAVSDTFPAILLNPSWTATQTGGATGLTANGAGNINDVVNLPAGATVVYTVTALIDPTATGTLSNTATATATNDPNSEDNTSTHTDQLSPQADLGVTKTSNVPTAIVGDTLIYTITVTNFGPSTVGSFTLTETLPPQVSVATQIPSAGSYNPATGAWTGISLATGQSVTLTVTGTVLFGAGGTITNSANVAPPPGVNDYNASNDGVVLSLPAIPRPINISGPAAPIPLLPLPQASKRSLLASTMAANDPLTGPYRAAVADFNSDGVSDTVVASPPGVADRVVVTDGATGAVLFSTAPFGGSFTGGLFVTTGDITGDNIPDLVVSPDQGGGPRVQVYSGAGFTKVLDFFGIGDPAFRGGARLAVGDVNADGAPELVVAAGYGGGPRITIWDGQSLRAGLPISTRDFFAFEPALRNGAYVAAGDLDGDGYADLVFGGGPGGAPRVRVFSGFSISGPAFNPDGTVYGEPQLANFFAGNPSARDGIRVAVWDTDGDGRGELVTGTGPTTVPPQLLSYDSPAVLAPGGTAPTDLTNLVDNFLLSAVFVG